MLVYVIYGRFNHGIEFFPDVEPDSAPAAGACRGICPFREKDPMLQAVERRRYGLAEVKALYARTLGSLITNWVRCHWR